MVAFTILILKRRDLTLYAFDPTHAHAIGLSPKRLGALLLGLLALTSVVALQTVGVVLVVAMLIIPGATAYLLTDRFSRMLVIAPVISAAVLHRRHLPQLLPRHRLRRHGGPDAGLPPSPSSICSAPGRA